MAEAAETGGMRLLRGLAREHRGRLSLALAASVLAAGLELVPYAAVYLAALEIFSPDPDPATFGWIAGLVFGGAALRYGFLGAGNLLAHAIAFDSLKSLRIRLTEKLGRVPLGFFAEHRSGTLKKTLVEDVSSLEGALAHNLPDLASGVIVPVVAIGWLLWVDWRMALVSLALLPLAAVLQGRTMSNMRERFEAWHAAVGDANEGVLDYLRGIPVLKSFDRDASSLQRLRSAVHGVKDMASRITRDTATGYAGFMLLVSTNLLVVLPVGLALHVEGSLPLADLVLFVVLGAGVTAPLLKLMFVFGNGQRTVLGAARIQAVLDAPELQTNLQQEMPTPRDASIRFASVTFAYREGARPALQDASFEIPSGTVTALVGSSGAGKTTIARLLARAWDPGEGHIELGGVNLRDLPPEHLARQIAQVSQDTFLFHATVLDNIRLGRPDATQDEVLAAAKAAYAHEFIEALPKGYNTLLGDRGARLSGGERQRIAIARALLLDAPVLVLDEATASVDPQSELAVLRGLSNLMTGRTVIVIAHRLRTILDAARIVVLADGRVADVGPHDALLERCDAYRELWDAQRRAEGWTLTGASA